jgi:hypothetical protein
MTEERAGAAHSRALATLSERGGRQLKTQAETAHDATAARGHDQVHEHAMASVNGGRAPASMHGCGAASAGVGACQETCQALLALLM